MGTSKIVTIIFIVLSCSFTANGLRCWICQNAMSERECRKSGYSTTCQGDQASCETEVRLHGWGSGLRITKGCKQSLACKNNEKQNPSECRPKSQNSVCRCCCKKNNCNKFNSCPKENLRCKAIPTPANGIKKCKSSSNELGSICTFNCKPGFHLLGNRVSICRRTAGNRGVEFDRPPPVCEFISTTAPSTTTRTTAVTVKPSPDTTAEMIATTQCRDPPHSALNGFRVCQMAKNGMVCSYSCAPDYTLSGPRIVTCHLDKGALSGWDAEPPICIPKCTIFLSSPVNGHIRCYGDGRLGTICEFGCDSGFALDGPKAVACVLYDNKPAWKPEMPNCKGTDSFH